MIHLDYAALFVGPAQGSSAAKKKGGAEVRAAQSYF